MAKQRNATRRLLLWTVGVVVVLVILGVVASATGMLGNRDDSVAVETEAVTIRNITQVVTASGKVQPEVEVKISPDVSGEIIDLRVNEGDAVRQGELLVRIRPDFYAAQVEQAQAGVLQAQAAVAQRKADLLMAEVEFKRQQDLHGKGVISESDFQTAQTQAEVARAALEAAQYAVQSAEARLREAREQLGKTSIYAPMSGTVSQLNVELGERVVGTSQMAGTEMMRIAKLDRMELEVDVNENDIVNVSVGDTASIEIDAYPEQVFRGQVTEIANSARISGAGSQEQVTNFPVKVRILHTQGGSDTGEGVSREEVPMLASGLAVLRPGMSGTLDIYTETVTGAIVVPIQSVTVRDFNKVDADSTGEADDEPAERARGLGTKEDLRKVVFLAIDGKARMVEVATGISDDTHVQVRRGLSGDEQVIMGPYRAVSRTLEPGMKVTVREPGEGPAGLTASAR